MEIKKRVKVKDFFKRFGAVMFGGVLVLALTVTGLVVGLTSNNTEIPDDDQNVSTGNLVFSLPMTNPEILKDFSSTDLQENATLNQWEAHLSMDLTSNDGFVYSILEGKVLEVGYSYDIGQYIKVSHSDGFVSTYANLSKDVLVEKGDNVTAGQKLAVASQTSSNESDMPAHLHFTLEQNSQKVDPNNFIEFQNK